MLKKISTVLLSLLIAAVAAIQVQGAQVEQTKYAVRVLPRDETLVDSGKKINGEISITAALQDMEVREEVTVKFMLTGDRYTYRATVVVTPDSEDEEGLLSATASFENLLSGSYRLSIESVQGAALDYILAEKGSESRYTMQEDSITFYLSGEASSGSAWFMLQEEVPASGDGAEVSE